MAECHPAGDESGGIPIERGKLQHRERAEIFLLHSGTQPRISVLQSQNHARKTTRFKIIILMWYVSPLTV